MSQEGLLAFLEDFLQCYRDGSLIPILMKGPSPFLVVYSRVMDPYLLDSGNLRLVFRLEEERFLSARLLTRCLTPYRDTVLLVPDEQAIRDSLELHSLLDVLCSTELSSCTGFPGGKKPPNAKDFLVERIGERLAYRSMNCTYVVDEERNGVCSHCERANRSSSSRRPNTLKRKKEDPIRFLSKEPTDTPDTASEESRNIKDALRKRTRVSFKKSKKSSLQCPSCEKEAFDGIKDFKEHCANHPNVFVCHYEDTCFKTFKSQNYLDIHLRRHQGIKKSHDCPTCGKHFLSNGDLQIHSYTHSGVKPFDCTICGKRFVKKSLLSIHMNVHTGEKPHLCSECGTSFASISTLIDHRKRRHMFHRPYKCPTCQKTFFSKQDLNNHSNTHSGIKPFTCSICDKSFSRSHHLKRHIAVLHKGLASSDKTLAAPTAEEEKEDDVLAKNDPTEILHYDPKDISEASLLDISQIVAGEDDADYANAKYVIIEGEDGSAKLIQYSSMDNS